MNRFWGRGYFCGRFCFSLCSGCTCWRRWCRRRWGGRRNAASYLKTRGGSIIPLLLYDTLTSHRMSAVTVVRALERTVELFASGEFHEVTSAVDEIFRVRVQRTADEK